MYIVKFKYMYCVYHYEKATALHNSVIVYYKPVYYVRMCQVLLIVDSSVLAFSSSVRLTLVYPCTLV